MRRLVLALSLCIAAAAPATAWDGYDIDSGTDLTIESGNLVRSRRSIEVYDWGSGEYRDVDVIDLDRFGNSVEIEVFDYEGGQYRTFEMED
jgi:hypothetical protein